MKKIIALALAMVCILTLSACNQKENEDILHLGINAEIVEIDTEEVSFIQFDDLAVGDKVVINAYESQLASINDGVIKVEQIQLATQRLNAD